MLRIREKETLNPCSVQRFVWKTKRSTHSSHTNIHKYPTNPELSYISAVQFKRKKRKPFVVEQQEANNE